MHAIIDVGLRATIVLVLAAAASLALRRSPAALRHLVWALAIGSLIALPITSALLPPLAVPVLPSAQRGVGAAPVTSDAPSPPAAAVRTERPATTSRDRTVSPSKPTDLTPRRGISWRSWVVPLWAAGAGLVLAALVLGLARVWMLARAGAPLTDESWTRLARTLAGDLGLARPVTLLRATGPTMPMTWGVRRPVILLPAEADQWSEARRHDVLLHELAHVARLDVLTQLAARLVCAAYWFHPLVWLAATRLRIERERACDDRVLRAGARASDYASHLLELARSLRVTPATALASVAMARPSQLANRLLDVLDARRRRDGVTLRASAPSWIAAALVVLPLATVTPTRPADRTLAPRPPLRAAERASRAARSSAVSADTLKGCDHGGSPRRHSSVHVNDGTAIHTTVGRCDAVFKAEGRFTFSEDFTDIATVARGGEVVVDLDDGEHVRRLTITPGAAGGGGGGTLERVFSVDRETRPFDAEARQWLAETLTLLLRTSGMAAEERAAWILKHRGINGLVEEIALIQSDYARRRYYDAAFESGKLDAAATERLIQRASQEIQSDYELAELLIGIAQRQPLTEGMQAGFVAAARSIKSDYERRRVLDAALQREGLSPAAANAMLEAATEINSDYELAELLIRISGARPIDDAVRAAFFDAANTIQSDYEHHRVLAAAVNRAGASPSVVQAALTSAAGIRSSYELAEFLIQVAQRMPLDEGLRRPFFLAAKAVSSDHDQARVLGTLADRRDLPKPVVASLLEAAKGVGSDYELAELLIKVARNQRIDDALRPAFEAAAQTIQSQYDNDRVMAALARNRGRVELE